MLALAPLLARLLSRPKFGFSNLPERARPILEVPLTKFRDSLGARAANPLDKYFKVKRHPADSVLCVMQFERLTGKGEKEEVFAHTRDYTPSDDCFYRLLKLPNEF